MLQYSPAGYIKRIQVKNLI